MKTFVCPSGLGAFSVNQNVYLYYNMLENGGKKFRLDRSNNGFDFEPFFNDPEIIDDKKRVQSTAKCSDFRISQVDGKFFMTYKMQMVNTPHLRTASSENLIHWHKVGSIDTIRELGMVVPGFTSKSRYVMYYGEQDIKVAYSDNLTDWTVSDAPALSPRVDMFDHGSLIIGTVSVVETGIRVLYYAKTGTRDDARYAIGIALFDKQNPEKILSRATAPIHSHLDEFTHKHVHPVGLIEWDGTLLSYWDIENEGIAVLAHPLQTPEKKTHGQFLHLALEKIKQNPILKPITDHLWENRAVFNPGAIYNQGRVHLVYRAVGERDISVIGYASSPDGVTFDTRLSEPAYIPTQQFECNPTGESSIPSLYASGSAYGGCEDPRITQIDDKLYMTYVAYDGHNPPRVALTSIDAADFYAQKWNWKKPVLISAPGVVDKNAAILPEKVNGKYVVFHRIFPNILVDYVDSLDDFDGTSNWLEGKYAIRPDRNSWDSRKVGVGAPPIRTKDGWLMIYHAVGDQDPSRYKMGAMLLDANDPTRVLFRSKKPILEPQEWYENEGMKFGVAYPCGAAVVKDDLFVYYGGADMVVCAAKANVDDFVGRLRHSQQAQLAPVRVRSFV